jgi:hypothetical protein
VKSRVFLANIQSVETGEEKNLATFYLMNTTATLNRWGVSNKALEESLPTILGKPIGCGPEYKVDDHYPNAMNLGTFVKAEKPDGYALGTTEITDTKAWEKLVSGEWGPISVVILSYRETCSRCGKELTQSEDPFSHSCIADGEAYVLVESFVFSRADFIDVPAVPQAGLIKLGGGQFSVPLELCAKFYESQSKQDPVQGPGAKDGSNPVEEMRKNQLENELQAKIDNLEEKLSEERSAREAVEAHLAEIRAREHEKHVVETLHARIEAGLVDDAEQEKTRLDAKEDSDLHELVQDAHRVIAKLQSKEAAPKAKYTGVSNEFTSAVDEAKQRLFGRRAK